MKSIALAAGALGLLLANTSLYADSWALPAEVKDTEFKFGDTRIVLHYDTTTNQSYPRYELRIHAKDQLLATHENIGFEQVFSDPQHAYFLGVSNRGLIKQAYVIFDRQGRILKEQKHDPRKVHYIRMSITLMREWYDAKNPQPEFVVQDGKLTNVRIRALDGKVIALMDPETQPLPR